MSGPSRASGSAGSSGPGKVNPSALKPQEEKASLSMSYAEMDVIWEEVFGKALSYWSDRNTPLNNEKLLKTIALHLLQRKPSFNFLSTFKKDVAVALLAYRLEEIYKDKQTKDIYPFFKRFVKPFVNVDFNLEKKVLDKTILKAEREPILEIYAYLQEVKSDGKKYPLELSILVNASDEYKYINLPEALNNSYLLFAGEGIKIENVVVKEATENRSVQLNGDITVSKCFDPSKGTTPQVIVSYEKAIPVSKYKRDTVPLVTINGLIKIEEQAVEISPIIIKRISMPRKIPAPTKTPGFCDLNPNDPKCNF